MPSGERRAERSTSRSNSFWRGFEPNRETPQARASSTYMVASSSCWPTGGRIASVAWRYLRDWSPSSEGNENGRSGRWKGAVAGSTQSATEPVSFTKMSRVTSRSSDSNASRSRPELAIVINGFPPVTNSARIWPSPGVRISSASTPPANAPLVLRRPPMRE